MKTLEVATLPQRRTWLRKHHDSVPEVWLIFHKKHTGTPSVAYKDALDEALCYGWIDSLVKRIDDNRFARKFTPRRTESNWSSINIKRYYELKDMKRLAAPGLARSPEGRPVVDAPPPIEIPASIERAIREDSKAWAFFKTLPPREQRAFLGWIAMAKRDETRQKRMEETLTRLRAGQRLGLK
jgi:uncharacterized protein YdeI (YjbR/CyaY-like superfamily)